MRPGDSCLYSIKKSSVLSHRFLVCTEAVQAQLPMPLLPRLAPWVYLITERRSTSLLLRKRTPNFCLGAAPFAFASSTRPCLLKSRPRPLLLQTKKGRRRKSNVRTDLSWTRSGAHHPPDGVRVPRYIGLPP